MKNKLLAILAILTVMAGIFTSPISVGAQMSGTSITGTVFNDLDGDGVKDIGDNGVADIQIDFTSEMSYSTVSTTTGSDGSYTSPVFTPSEGIKVKIITSYTLTTPVEVRVQIPVTDPENPWMPVTGPVVNFGIRLPGTIDARVFNDLNGNGIPESGEPGISGVNLSLKRGDTNASSGITSFNGTYSFTSLEAGTYTVTETDPTGYASTTSNQVTAILNPGSPPY